MSSAEEEGEWLSGLIPADKARFLAALGHALTIAGRASYEVGGTGLVDASYLRQVNEIQHRVLGCLTDILNGGHNASFVRSIAQWVLSPSDAGVATHAKYAWQNAKEFIRGNVV
jgi:hypothetical protein